MSTAVLNLINQLNPYEETQVIDYVEKLISNRETVSDEEGRKNFYAIREEALKNKPDGMTLDEINEIIGKARKETINGLDSKISEYENNHKDGKGKYYTLDEVNTILDKAIKTGR